MSATRRRSGQSRRLLTPEFIDFVPRVWSDQDDLKDRIGPGDPKAKKTDRALLASNLDGDTGRGASCASVFACGPYWVILRCREAPRGLELVSLEVVAHKSGKSRPPIKQDETLRRLPLPEMFAKTKAEWAKWAQMEMAAPAVASMFPNFLRVALMEAAETQKPQRRRDPKKRFRHDRDHYREVAKVYQAADVAGGTPTRAVAEHFRYSYGTAARWVMKARELGFLPKTERAKGRVREARKRAGRSKG